MSRPDDPVRYHGDFPSACVTSGCAPTPMRLLFARCLLVLFLACAGSTAALASGGGQSAPEPLRFTVNLGKTKYLQIELVLVGNSPEVEHELVVLRPRIMHEVILLLSSQSAERLFTREGKHALSADIVEAANHVIHENEKTGVKEVLFTSFIIQ